MSPPPPASALMAPATTAAPNKQDVDLHAARAPLSRLYTMRIFLGRVRSIPCGSLCPDYSRSGDNADRFALGGYRQEPDAALVHVSCGLPDGVRECAGLAPFFISLSFVLCSVCVCSEPTSAGSASRKSRSKMMPASFPSSVMGRCRMRRSRKIHNAPYAVVPGSRVPTSRIIPVLDQHPAPRELNCRFPLPACQISGTWRAGIPRSGLQNYSSDLSTTSPASSVMETERAFSRSTAPLSWQSTLTSPTPIKVPAGTGSPSARSRVTV